MSGTVQMLLVLAIVLAAAAYVGRRAWATLRPKKSMGCDAGCGCGGADESAKDWAKS